jgi:hypothetical protein
MSLTEVIKIPKGQKAEKELASKDSKSKAAGTTEETKEERRARKAAKKLVRFTPMKDHRSSPLQAKEQIGTESTEAGPSNRPIHAIASIGSAVPLPADKAAQPALIAKKDKKKRKKEEDVPISEVTTTVDAGTAETKKKRKKDKANAVEEAAVPSESSLAKPAPKDIETDITPSRLKEKKLKVGTEVSVSELSTIQSDSALSDQAKNGRSMLVQLYPVFRP